jgi:hypothetical protein
MAQEVEHLSKFEALRSNPSTTIKKEKKIQTCLCYQKVKFYPS